MRTFVSIAVIAPPAQPVMHGGTIGDIHSGRQPAIDRHPGQFDCFRSARRSGGPADFGPQPPLEKLSQRLPKFRRPLLGGDEKFIGNINGRFHMGKHIPVIMGFQQEDAGLDGGFPCLRCGLGWGAGAAHFHASPKRKREESALRTSTLEILDAV